jgi:hypothetical protein
VPGGSPAARCAFTGRAEEAIVRLDKALHLASSNAYLGRLDEAQASLAEALSLWPDVAIKWDLSSIFMAGDPALRDR